MRLANVHLAIVSCTHFWYFSIEIRVGRVQWEMSVPAVPAIDKLEQILASSENFLQRMHELGAQPNARKALGRLFSPSEAAQMVGRDRTTLARAEAEIGVEAAPRNPGNNRRLGYTLEQVQAFRRHFGTLPWRDPATDSPLVIACQNFKGGVGKSTTCVRKISRMRFAAPTSPISI
jgi:chromosome partitioning protein